MRFVSENIDLANRRAIATRQGGEVLGEQVGCVESSERTKPAIIDRGFRRHHAPYITDRRETSVMTTLSPLDTQPSLQTPRLVLRPMTLADAAAVQRLAGDIEVASTTLLIPHPYPDGAAEAWIATHAGRYQRGEAIDFAIEEKQCGQLVGAIGLVLAPPHERAELGYWIGRDYWGRGYCTEAGRAVVEFAFRVLNLHRVQASHFTRNIASGRVLQKIGLTHEGSCRGYVKKWDRFEDGELYAILTNDPS